MLDRTCKKFVLHSTEYKVKNFTIRWSFSSDNVLSIPLVLIDEYTNIFYKQITK
jgi:hypothetical protein